MPVLRKNPIHTREDLQNDYSEMRFIHSQVNMFIYVYSITNRDLLLIN